MSSEERTYPSGKVTDIKTLTASIDSSTKEASNEGRNIYEFPNKEK